MSANKPPFDGEWVKLGELISKAPIERCGDGKYPVYSMTMRDGIVEQAGRFKKAIASKDTSSYKVVKKNQLVVGFPIDEGVIYVQRHDAPGIMSPAYNVWNINLGRVDPSYLEFALHSPRSMAYYADKMRGTTARRRTLTADGLREMEIPLPSADGQIRVVDTLDEVRLLIKEANCQIAMLDTLVKSRFVEMFGDPCDPDSSKLPGFPLKNICDLRIGPFGSALHKEDYIVGGHPLVNPSHIVDGRIEVDNSLTVGDDKFASMGPYHLRRGDVVLGRRGEIGRCAVVDIEGLLCGTGSMILRPHADVCSSDYLQRVVSFPSFSTSLERQAVGVTMKNLNAKIVGSAVVVLPPLALQQEFAAFVAEVDKSRFIVQQKIEKLQMLYDSLAQEYFG